ncbi:uncharacterized protein LOC129589259 [Paramacrobiotus metropolitanus]|uniref:uncharacterized protein LOC129589259 n=1 Tax=Paramacrobiotus metropolitanus TaxID=2943436 RepID=UPI00244646B7|nr:uncharacterized protein LOC129589259 [Paramacrobiotus metropolitanus]
MSCDYDAQRNDFCNWTHANQTFRWSWSNSTTPSLNTGPSRDWTQTGVAGYIFVEASSRRINDTCYLNSPPIVVPADTAKICISFHVHMMGENMGSINVNIAEEEGDFATVYTRQGDHDNFWFPVKFELVIGKPTFRIQLQGIAGKDHLGDASIDGFRVETCAGDEFPTVSAASPLIEKPPGPQPIALPFSCDFQNNRCGFSQATDDGLDWHRVSGERETEYTGPTVDHTTGTVAGKYMYVESSSPSQPGDKARIISPLIRLNDFKKNDLCFEFFYHMYGTGMGTLSVTVTPSNCTDNDKNSLRWPACSEIVHSVSGDQGDRWRQFRNRAQYEWEEFTMEFEATLGVGEISFRSDIAIDDIHFAECPKNDSYVYPTLAPIIDYIDGCSGTAYVRNATGGIWSDPHYPNAAYLSDSKCRWVLESENSTKGLLLHYDADFFIEAAERCNLDYVRVFEGLSDEQLATFEPCGETNFDFKGPFCGSHAPPDHITRSNRAVVEFCSDNRNQREGFALFFREEDMVPMAEPDPACSTTLMLEDFEPHFLRWPPSPDNETYDNNLRCEMVLRNNNTANVIRINTGNFGIERSANCKFDYLEINDACNNERPKKYCGHDGPVHYRSFCPTVVLTFVTDNSIGGTGFDLVVYGDRCGQKKFYCEADAMCIDQQKVCDSRPDCPSGADEDPFMCHNLFACGHEYPSPNLPAELGFRPRSLHPWHAAILSHTRRLACSGTLIHPGWILTSALCASKFSDIRDMIIQLDSPVLDFRSWPIKTEVKPTKISLHPDFSPNTIEVDIALIKFASHPDYNPARIPACLLEDDEDFLRNGTKGVFGGFRHVPLTVPAPTRDPLLEPFSNATIFADTAEVEMLDLSYCNESVQHNLKSDKYLCTTPAPCETDGDLGAPLVFQRNDRYFLAGIYSYSAAECRRNFARPTPAIYTRIKSYSAWILDMLAEDAYMANV